MGLIPLLTATLNLIYINQFHVCFHKIMLNRNSERNPRSLLQGSSNLLYPRVIRILRVFYKD